jgi:adenylate cyclase
MGFYFNTSSEGVEDLQSGVLPDPVLGKDDFRGKRIDIPVAVGYGANLQQFQNSAMSGGHFNPSIDADGIVRRIPLLYEFEDQYYEALSLAMVRAIHNVDVQFIMWIASNRSLLKRMCLARRIIQDLNGSD